MGILATLIVNIGEFFVRKEFGVNFLVCEMRTKILQPGAVFLLCKFFSGHYFFAAFNVRTNWSEPILGDQQNRAERSEVTGDQWLNSWNDNCFFTNLSLKDSSQCQILFLVFILRGLFCCTTSGYSLPRCIWTFWAYTQCWMSNFASRDYPNSIPVS